MMVWFWLTPLFIEESTFPKKIQFLLAANPMFYVVRAYREILLHSAMPNLKDLAIAVASGVVAFAVGGLFFRYMKRGFADVNNRFGGNCFACHVKAKTEFDFFCEQTNGCDAVPFTRAMFGALQRTDPRCKNRPAVSAEDAQALKQLGELVKSLTSPGKTN